MDISTDQKMRTRKQNGSKTGETSSSNQYICDSCGTKYKNSRSLSNHKRIACGKKHSVSLSKCIYKDCDRMFYHKSKMLEHLKDDHKQEMQEELLTFKSKDEFLNWKEKEERSKYVYFSKQRRDVQVGANKLSYYVCQHDGHTYSHRKSTEPARKTSRKYKRGSVKSNIVCLARMMVKYTVDSVEVRYISSHSHEISLKNTEFQPMPSEVKQFIADQLLLGVSPKEIKGKLHEKLAERDKRGVQSHMRVQHLSLQAIYEMKKRMLFKGQGITHLHPNDIISVTMMVEKLKNEAYDPVLIYEKYVIENNGENNISQSNIQDDTFILGLQTKEQKDILMKNSGQIVSIDATSDSSVPYIYIFTILIRDEFGNGYPTAHFLSNKNSEQALTSMFKALKLRCSDFHSAAVITDDNPAIYTAFVNVFGSEKAGCHLFCQSHLACSWQKILNSEVQDKGLKSEIYNKLVTIMKQPTEESFHNTIELFYSTYSSKTPSVVEYVKSKCMINAQLWATCYRFPYAETDTSAFIESYHDRLKTYLSRQPYKRIDELFDFLLKMEVELYLERKQRLKQQCESGTGTSSIFQSRHKSSLRIPNEDVKKLGDVWYITSNKVKEGSYTVTKLMDHCTLDFCIEKCSESSCANLCQHMYSCTCPDRATLCKHVHKIHMLRLSFRRDYPIQGRSADANELDNMFVNHAIQNVHPVYPNSLQISTDAIPSQTQYIIPTNSQVDVQMQQIEAECSKLSKLSEDPAVKKYMLSKVLSTLEHTINYCQNILVKGNSDQAEDSHHQVPSWGWLQQY